MKKRYYCAIIGDINKSRSLANRDKIQRNFHKAITVINREYKKDIAAKFLITLGDEFQGVLASATLSYQCVRRMQELMAPVQFTFGIGIGTISTSFNTNTIAMDGEVFHRARRALEEAKKKKSLLRFDFNHTALPLTNAVAELIDKHQCRLSSRQRTVAALMKEHNNQSKVAKILKVSQPTIWKVVSSQHIRQLHEAETSLHAFLDSLITSRR